MSKRPVDGGLDETAESASPVSLYPGVGMEFAHYRITGVIESGGMGVVYEAVDRSSGRELALKVIGPRLAENETFRDRFLRETEVQRTLSNPHVLRVLGSGQVDGLLYIAMPLVGGGNLGQRLTSNGPLDLGEVVTVVEQIGRALEAVHLQNQVHRDVKPTNVLLDGESIGIHCYLMDFGIARDLSVEPVVTGSGRIMGTVDYIAPEIIEGGICDERVDTYALGCMAVELLTGTPPFRRDTKEATLLAHLREEPELTGLPSTVDRELLASALKRAVERDPGSRFASPMEFARALASVPASRRA